MSFKLLLLIILAIYFTISYILAAPLGKSLGLCPKYTHTYRKNMPFAAVVQMGESMHLKDKSDAIGVFILLSLLSSHELYSKKAHQKYALIYKYADISLTECTCAMKGVYKHDPNSQFYHFNITVPKVYPDSIYTISITHHGIIKTFPRALRQGFAGCFGNSRILVTAQPYRMSYGPRSTPAFSLTGNKKCGLGTVNWSHCTRVRWRKCAVLGTPARASQRVKTIAEKRPKPYARGGW